jgi:hypothetical protein
LGVDLLAGLSFKGLVTFRDWRLSEGSSDLHQLKKLGWSLRRMEEKGD